MNNDILTTYPVRKCEFINNEGKITVLFKKEKLNFFEKLFSSGWGNKPQKIDLDEIGSFIWLLCDGTKTVEDIIKMAKNEFSDKIEPADQRVPLFINQMANTKLVQLFIKTKSE